MNTINRLLEESVFHYKKLLGKTKKIEPLLDKVDPEELTRLSESIQEMQKYVRRADKKIMRHLQGKKEDIQNNPLFQERLELMEKIIEHNNFISPKIYDRMSVSQAELKAIRHGIRGVSGYQRQSKKNSNRIHQIH